MATHVKKVVVGSRVPQVAELPLSPSLPQSRYPRSYMVGTPVWVLRVPEGSPRFWLESDSCAAPKLRLWGWVRTGLGRFTSGSVIG